MSLKITHKYSTAAGTPPASGDIDVGELAINAADAALYVKDTNGNIKNPANSATFTQSGTGAVQRTVESKLQDVVNVKDFGAVGDGATDDTSAIQAAVNTQKPVYMPAGAYVVSDMISLNSGQLLHGDGPTKSRFIIPANFNLAALGVVRLGSSEPGAILRNVGFEFVQPETFGTARADLVQFPPAVYAADVPRFSIDNVRWSRAWVGLDMTGNAGGAYIGRVESGAFHKGLMIDGALDFVHIDSWHSWPFGATTGVLNTIYNDGETIAAEIGRADGFAVDKFASFHGRVVITDPGATNIPLEFGILQLDGDNSRLVISGGLTRIGQLYSTKSNVAAKTIHVTGGRTSIDLANIVGSETDNQIHVEGGLLRIYEGEQLHSQTDSVAARVSGGVLEIRDMTPRWPNVARTQPFYLQEGTGSLRLVNSIPDSSQSTSTNLVTVTTDTTANWIEGNHLAPHTITLPSSLNLGHYETDFIGFTPSLVPETLGDWSVGSYGIRSGYYQIDGDWVNIHARFIGTPTFTTASGGLKITGFPFTFGRDSEFSTQWTQGFSLGTNYQNVICRSLNNESAIGLLRSGASVGIAGISTSNVVSGTPVHIFFTARVALR